LAKNENNVLFARLVDPANSNNILSDLMTIKEKQAIVSAARKSVKEQYWGSIVY
jgi:hypothetical protein